MRVLPAAATADVALAFIELGAIIVGLALLARLSDRFGLSPVPAYLLAGLAFGEGGIVAPAFTDDFIALAAEIGVILLLLTLGLEYTGEDLSHSLRRRWPAGLVDLVANFTPGAIAALVMDWGVAAAILLGGATYISSSGVIAKVLTDLGRMTNRESPAVLSLLVVEDLAMAVYLPMTVVMLAGGQPGEAALAIVVALGVTALVLTTAIRYGTQFSRRMATRSDEALLLSVLGVTLLVAGLAQAMDVSAAVGAFLVGIALSGPVQHRASALIGPLRDVFAATFFLLFGMRIDPSDIGGVLGAAVLLALITALTKVFTGWWVGTRVGVGPRGRMRAGTVLIARGEFSIIIAGLAVGHGLHPDLVPFTGAYVLVLASAAPVITRFADPLADRLQAFGALRRRGRPV